jgi:hypothetical protein
MFKRLFFATLGLGAGVALGVYAVRKVEQAQQRFTPEHLAASAGERAQVFSDRMRAAIAEGRAAATAKEAELRAVYRVGEWESPASSPDPE